MRERAPKAGLLNVVVRFEMEGGVKKVDPMKLTKIVRWQVGEVKHTRVFGDGNLLIGYINRMTQGGEKKGD